MTNEEQWKHNLSLYRQTRGIDKPQTVYTEMMIEEYNECVEALNSNDIHEEIDGLCDMLVLTTNQLTLEFPGSLDKQTIYVDDGVSSLLESNLHTNILSYEYKNIRSKDMYNLLNLITAQLRQLVTIKGYDVDCCMLEVVKHISAREQLPAQKVKWELQGGNLKGEKWLKDKDQDISTLYEPNYDRCKLKGK